MISILKIGFTFKAIELLEILYGIALDSCSDRFARDAVKIDKNLSAEQLVELD